MSIKIGIFLSNYYPKISKNLYDGALSTLKKYKGKKSIINGSKFMYKDPIKLFSVSGSYEIPVLISRNIKSFDAVIALGCIIKGKTPHFEFISSAITNAIMKLSIENKKPIGNGILTCLNKKQALERSDPNNFNKGGEAVRAILSVLGYDTVHH